MSSFTADFSPKVGSPKRAATYFISGVISVVIIPVLLLTFSKDIGAWIASMTPLIEVDDLTAAMDLVKGMATVCLVYCIPVLIFMIPIGFYPDGSWSRLTFRLISGVYALYWTYMIINGGIIYMDATGIDYTSGSLTITSMNIVADFTGFVTVILALVALRLIIPLAEFYGARDEFLHGNKKGHTKKELDRTQRVKGRHQGD